MRFQFFSIIITGLSLFASLQCSNRNPVAAKKQDGWQPMNEGMGPQTVQCLAVAKSSPQVMYAGTLAGAFRSEDSGEIWLRIDDDLPGHDIKSIAVDRTDKNRIFLGTWGKGVFKSVNGGQTWMEIWSKGQDPRIYLLYLSGDNKLLWAGTENGLYKSSDGGETWQRSFDYGRVQAILEVPDQPSTILIGVHADGIFKSDDNGESWRNVSTGLYHTSDGTSAANCFVVSPNNGSEMIISTGWVDLFKTTDGGEKWSQFAGELNGKKVVALAIDKNDPTILWAGTQEAGIYRSLDGGQTWQAFNDGLDSIEIKTLQLVNDKRTTVYVGTVGYGIYRYSYE